jgi:nucleoid-associated protein YgaU
MLLKVVVIKKGFFVINNFNLFIKSLYKLLFIIFLFPFLGIISYFGYAYLQKSSNTTTHTQVQKSKVMGVTHISNQGSLSQADIDYAAEIEKLDEPDIETEYHSQLVEYMNKEIKKISNQNVPKDRWRDITITVKKGDTLATLAQKYYHDSNAYDKIIKNNPELTEESHVIYPGQKLKISQNY